MAARRGAMWRPVASVAIATAMRDRVFLPLLALVALVLIGLALVWPQGEGRPSPAPFGRPVSPMRPTPSAGGKAADAGGGIAGQESNTPREP